MNFNKKLLGFVFGLSFALLLVTAPVFVPVVDAVIVRPETPRPTTIRPATPMSNSQLITLLVALNIISEEQGTVILMILDSSSNQIIPSNDGVNYPKLDLLTPEINGYTVTQNGVTFPLLGPSYLTGVTLDTTWCKKENPRASGSGPFEFSWGDGSKSCSWFPASHTYLSATGGEKDPYRIEVRVKNSAGRIASRDNYVHIIPNSTVDVNTRKLNIVDVIYKPYSVGVNELITTDVVIVNNSRQEISGSKVNVQGTLVGIPTLRPGRKTTVTVPNAFSFSVSGTHRLSTVIVDSNNNSSDVFTNKITVREVVGTPSITVLSPNGGEVLVQGEKHSNKYSISWNTNNEVSRVHAFLVPADSDGFGSGSLGIIGSVDATKHSNMWWDGRTVWTDLHNGKEVNVPNGSYKIYLVGDVANVNGKVVRDMSDSSFMIVSATPSFPASASTASCGLGIDVSWANMANAKEFWIARNSNQANFAREKYDMSTSVRMNTSFSDKNAPAGSTQYYKVWYKNQANKWIGSDIFTGVSAQKCDPVIDHPGFPANATTSINGRGIEVTWANIPGAKEYWIARNSNRANFESGKHDLSRSVGMKTNFSDQDMPAGSTQYYKVWYKNQANKWIGSNIFSGVASRFEYTTR